MVCDFAQLVAPTVIANVLWFPKYFPHHPFFFSDQQVVLPALMALFDPMCLCQVATNYYTFGGKSTCICLTYCCFITVSWGKHIKPRKKWFEMWLFHKWLLHNA